jgi:predicted nucleotide-binding protein
MAELEAVRAALEAAGQRHDEPQRNRDDHGWVVRVPSADALVNVYDNGTCQVQGRGKEAVEAALGELVGRSGGRAPRTPAAEAVTDVFVVYGRDHEARTELEAMLRRWGLNPLILDQLPSEGATLIEKLEKYQQSVNFAVVLATPDDEGHIAGEPDKSRPRARQNVVLELGMVLTKLGRSRVAILLKNAAEIERPSDIDGLIYISFDKRVEEKKVELAKEMKKQGYRINLDDL